MKKLIAWFLVLAMCVSMFAACGQEATQPTTQPIEPASTEAPAVENVGNPEALASVLEYLTTIYKDAGGLTPKDFTRIGTIPFGTDKYEVVWTASVGEDLVKIVRGEDGMVTIDVSEECDAETPYTLTATITDAAGNSVSHSWEHVLPAAMNVADILDAAYALESGASLAYEVTLTGKVVSVDDMWSDKYGNITVTIAMEGHEDRPVKCYRLAGDGAKDLAVGDTITVTGTITNYKGIIEFAQGCTLDSRISGGGEAPSAVVYEYYRPFPDGTVLLIYNRDSGMALSEKKTGYYNVGVKRSNYGATEVWTAILHSDGTYSFANADGETIGLGSDYSSLNLGEKYDRWGIIKLDCGKFLIENAGRKGMFLEWYDDYDNFSTYNKYAPETDPQFIMNFLFLDEDEIPEEEEEPVYTLAPEMVTSPVADTPYKMYVEQENLDKVLYFTGKTANKDYYLATTENPEEAIDVYVETVEGGYRLYFLDGETKVYIDSYLNGTFNNARLTTEPTAVYTYDSTYNTYVANVEGTDTYVGTYSGYETLSVSKYDYISTSFPSHLGVLVEKEAATLESIAISGTAEYTVGDTLALTVTATYSDGDTKDVTELAELSGYDMSVAGEYTVTASYDGKTAEYKITVAEATEEEPSEPETSYKFGMVQGNKDNTIYYLKGGMDGYYMDTTTDIAEAIDVYLEETTGGYYFYTKDENGDKLYINMVVSGTYVNGKYETTASTVYTHDEEKNTVVATINGKEYVFGTRNDKTYTTMGPVLATNEPFLGQFDPEVPATAYKFGMVQGNKDNTIYYLKGGMDSYYMATTTDIAEAIDVYLEETTGGYYFYTKDEDGDKLYINMVVSGTYVNGKYETTASTVYTHDEEKNTVVATINGKEYVFGTRNDKTYTTMGPVLATNEPFLGQFDPKAPETETEPDSGTEDTAEGITITFDDTAKRTEFDTTKQVWVENGITVTNEKAASTTDVADYAKPARFYASSSLKIEVEGMTKIEFTCNSTSYATALKNSIGDAAVVDGKVVTVEMAEAVDVYEIAKLTAQVRMDSITVYVKETTGSESDDTTGGDAGDSSETYTATITFDNTAKRTAVDTTQQVWEENGITVTVTKGTGADVNSNYYNPIRCYKGHNLKVEHQGMVKIEIDCYYVNSTPTYVDALKATLEANSVTYTMSGDDVFVIEFAEKQAAFELNSFTNQVRLDGITVTYEG